MWLAHNAINDRTKFAQPEDTLNVETFTQSHHSCEAKKTTTLVLLICKALQSTTD